MDTGGRKTQVSSVFQALKKPSWDGLEGLVGSGGRIRTYDLRVMSPTSYRTAPPRTGEAHTTA